MQGALGPGARGASQRADRVNPALLTPPAHALDRPNARPCPRHLICAHPLLPFSWSAIFWLYSLMKNLSMGLSWYTVLSAKGSWWGAGEGQGSVRGLPARGQSAAEGCATRLHASGASAAPWWAAAVQPQPLSV